MATLPGLPMFGHGQIEGFTEKYGMEYRRPRYDETADHWLVERHEREIAPLLQRRWLFAESSNFLLYDFFQDNGTVDENVFAYSNRKGGERALVVYNNRYGTAHGTIDFSAAYADKDSAQLRQRRLQEGLGLGVGPATVLAWRDSLTGLEYLRRATDLAERGLTLDLHAYQCHVFLDWRELHATAEKPWDRLCDLLNGQGVPNLDDALVNLELRPVHDALKSQLDLALVRLFADLAEHPRTLAVAKDKRIEAGAQRVLRAGMGTLRIVPARGAKGICFADCRSGPARGSGYPTNPALLGPAFRERLRAAMRIPAVEALFPAPWTVAARRMLPSPSPQLTATAMWGPVLGWCALELLAESIDVENPERVALDLFDRLRLREPFAKAFATLGFEGEEGWRVAARIKVVLLTGAGVGKAEEVPAEAKAADAPEEPVATPAVTAAPIEVAAPEAKTQKPPAPQVEEKVALSPALWLDPDVRWLTGVHEAAGHSYLVSELYEELLWWLLMPSLLRLAGEIAPSRTAVEEMSRTVEEALATAKAAGYRIDALLGQESAPEAGDEPAVEAESQVLEEEQTLTDESDTQEPVIEPLVEGETEVVEPNPVEPA